MTSKIESFIKEVLEPQILVRMKPMDDYDAGVTEGMRKGARFTTVQPQSPLAA